MAERVSSPNHPVFRLRLVAPLLAASLFLLLLLLSASPAFALGIESFETSSSTQEVGAHPDLTTSFSLEDPGQPNAAKNVVFNAPEGLFGNINAVTNCTAADFAFDQCPVNSQVGLITIHANYAGDPDNLLGTAPIYDVAPEANETARLSFVAPKIGVPESIPVQVRTGSDYGLRFTISDLTQLAPLASARITLWGFPAEAGHDQERFPKGSPGNPPACVGAEDTSCIASPTKASIGVSPLIDNPTVCTGAPLRTTLEVQSYQDPGHPSVAESDYPATTDCEKETFNPNLGASITTSETDSASGLNLLLKTAQFEGFAASPSQLRSATVSLPEGLTINPDAADGQTACPDDQANLHSEAPAACPDSSKIGTFTIGTPTLDGPLEGGVFIGQPKPGDQYRLFLTASGFGINAKLVGSVRPDPATGRLTAVFEDLPQVPFETFQLHLFASDRGLLATPTGCTQYPVTGYFTPWNARLSSQHVSQGFGLQSGPHGTPCPGQIRPFNPHLKAGTSNPAAGAFSSFSLKLDREDGEQFLGKLNFTLPQGMSAYLRGVDYCPDTSIASAANQSGALEKAVPSCPASSQIGTSNVAAGPGSHPFHAIGAVYLAGPFQGAPLSLAVITPALAGPFDYGTVVVRVALHVDPLDAHVVADSETVPSIIGGVPLRLRSIQVNVDRQQFMLNPTNCSSFAVVSEGVGDQGAPARFSSPFTAVNCATLPFKPRMAITQLGGRKGTRRTANPRVQFDLYTRPGDANLESVAVTLPTAFEIDQRHLRGICSKAELERDQCAGKQAIGSTEVNTPLLDQPLSGPAYAVSGYGKLPHLAFVLNGQVTVVPQAKSASVKHGHLRTTVPVIPDVPLGHFRLTLLGEKVGYLVNTRSLCAAPVVTDVEFFGQNGSSLTQHVKAKAACKGKTVPKHR